MHLIEADNKINGLKLLQKRFKLMDFTNSAALYNITLYLHSLWNHRSAIHMEPDRVRQEGSSGQECHTGSGLELDFLFVP